MGRPPLDVGQYREQGFAVLRNAFSTAAIEPVKAAAQRIVEQFDPEAHRSIFTTRDRDRGLDDYFMSSGEAVRCFLEEDAIDENGGLNRPRELAINKIGHALHDLVPEFRAFCRDPLFARILNVLGHRQSQLWQTMYIFKQPHIGGEVRWHQDATYLITRPPAITGFWLAIEDAHRQNGCLWVQPGGHHGPLREIYEVDPNTRRGELRPLDSTPWPGTDEGIPVEVPAGSLIIFHDHMPHYSSHNHSNLSRHALTLHFAPSAAKWHQENWLQRPTLPNFVVG